MNALQCKYYFRMSLLSENVFNASNGFVLTDAGNFLIYLLVAPFSSDVRPPKIENISFTKLSKLET